MVAYPPPPIKTAGGRTCSCRRAPEMERGLRWPPCAEGKLSATATAAKPMPNEPT